MTSKLIRNAILVARWGVVVGALVLVMILILTILADQVLSRTLTREDVEQRVIEHSSGKSVSYRQTYDWKDFDRAPKPIDTIYFYDTNFYMLGKQFQLQGDPSQTNASLGAQEREEEIGEVPEGQVERE